MLDHSAEGVPSIGSDTDIDRSTRNRERDTIMVDRASRAECSTKSGEELALISVNTAFVPSSSNPVSPGPSSPSLDQTRDPDFVPPTRPSSTPFPNSDNIDANCCFSPFLEEEDDYGSSTEPYADDFQMVPPATLETIKRPSALNSLPPEILEVILDHLFGYRVSASSKSSLRVQSVTLSWNTALRHSRRKEVSALALVNSSWRVLVQQRLFRHIKLKAARDYLGLAAYWLSERDHLRSYVKHVELWFPVFQPKPRPLGASEDSAALIVPWSTRPNNNYALPPDNCSLEDVFSFLYAILPNVLVLTLEGGERKKAPKVRHANSSTPGLAYLNVLPCVRTLVTKGQWNILRTDEDFNALLGALPNLAEWHGSYSKPKSKSYLSVHRMLPQLPASLTSLHLTLESDYRRELSYPPFFLKVLSQIHFCYRLAEAAVPLEHLSFTGRVCKCFFLVLASRSDPRLSKLKSIDLTVKNCCRNIIQFTDFESGSGIQDLNFIYSFESLVVAALRALPKLPNLQYLRIRFVDLDSPVPPLNPYFLLKGDTCWGVWSEFILTELHKARPGAGFEELNESFGEIGYNKEGRLVISTVPSTSSTQLRSLKISNYARLTGSIASMA